MPSFHFPQNYRRFSATVCRFFIFFVFILNILSEANLYYDAEKNMQNRIMQNPYNSSYHEKLGQFYLSLNKEAAEREYKLAQHFFLKNPSYGSSVLGDQSPPLKTWDNLLMTQSNLRQERNYWELIHRKYPRYLYAFQKLAVINLELGEKNNARVLLQEAMREFPADPLTFQLMEKLENLGN